MKKFVTILGAVLLTALTVQMASAGQRDGVRKVDRVKQSQQLRDSNAYYAPDTRDWRGDAYGGYGYNSRLDALREGGGISAPAGQ